MTSRAGIIGIAGMMVSGLRFRNAFGRGTSDTSLELVAVGACGAGTVGSTSTSDG